MCCCRVLLLSGSFHPPLLKTHMPADTLQTHPVMLGFVIFLGLCLGSFATAVAWRVPRGEQFIHGRSRCPSCHHALGIPDLAPVLSWLWLRGKCRHCGVRFGSAYIWAELATALFVTLAYLQFGLTPTGVVMMAFALCMVILIIIDLQHTIIPDGLNLTMLVLAILYQAVEGAPPERFLIGPVAGVGFAYALRQLMWVWKKQEGLGMGDVKFAATIGLFLPLNAITTFLFLSGMIGIVTALLWKALGKGERFPFGPALCLALYACLLVPEFGTVWQEIMDRWLSQRV